MTKVFRGAMFTFQIMLAAAINRVILTNGALCFLNHVFQAMNPF